ncbi:unnamed protein product [Ectocarpus sp. 12 AP-2014]
MSLNGAMLRVGAGAAAVVRSTIGKPSYGGAALAVTGRRSMTTFQERERGEETVYMRKEDKRLLENLLKKERAHHEAGKDVAKDELMAILGSHKLPSDVVEKIIAWKSSH